VSLRFRPIGPHKTIDAKYNKPHHIGLRLLEFLSYLFLRFLVTQPLASCSNICRCHLSARPYEDGQSAKRFMTA
jgi:hypothetical protein